LVHFDSLLAAHGSKMPVVTLPPDAPSASNLLIVRQTRSDRM
jgi:hypothetical protein